MLAFVVEVKLYVSFRHASAVEKCRYNCHPGPLATKTTEDVDVGLEQCSSYYYFILSAPGSDLMHSITIDVTLQTL